ncbi:TPA: hypothetical protein DEG21_00265 [Patescibacteria group bacterium]|nr:hypothetical protein [Candidatus Gracilibacteria bacterium]HBY74360.1 hypothetical protein [Candidatus Gracilibacteria bacterium]
MFFNFVVDILELWGITIFSKPSFEASSTLFWMLNTFLIIQVKDISQINIVLLRAFHFFEEIIAAIVARSIQGSAIESHLEIFT